VVERRSRHSFEAETFPRFPVSCHAGRQRLDGDLTIEPWVACAVYDSHAALANRAENLIGTKANSIS
jgi:hypothetical protein